jgi:hypothetical protein
MRENVAFPEPGLNCKIFSIDFFINLTPIFGCSCFLRKFKTLNILIPSHSVFYDFLLKDQVTKNLATISPFGLVPVDVMVKVLLSPCFKELIN